MKNSEEYFDFALTPGWYYTDCFKYTDRKEKKVMWMMVAVKYWIDAITSEPKISIRHYNNFEETGPKSSSKCQRAFDLIRLGWVNSETFNNNRYKHWPRRYNLFQGGWYRKLKDSVVEKTQVQNPENFSQRHVARRGSKAFEMHSGNYAPFIILKDGHIYFMYGHKSPKFPPQRLYPFRDQ